MEIQGPGILDPTTTNAAERAATSRLDQAAGRAGTSPVDRAALEEAAREFEGVFLNTLLKAMRQTVPESELFNGGGATKFYRQMHDAEIARNLAGSGSGTGIANMIINQLDRDGTSSRPRPPLVGPPSPGALARYRALQPVDDFHDRLTRTRMLAAVQGTAATDTLQRFGSDLARAAQDNDLDPALLLAVVMQESGGDPDAVSPKGARGLMQLMPDTARELGVEDIADPAQNLDGGARYLAEMLEQFEGRLDLALAAYNAGPGAVRSAGHRIPDYRETVRYVEKVMERYRGLGGGTKMASLEGSGPMSFPKTEDEP